MQCFSAAVFLLSKDASSSSATVNLCFRLRGGRVPVRLRQQRPLLPPGGDSGCRSRGNHRSEVKGHAARSGLLPARLTRLSAAPHRPGAAPPGRQRAVRAQGGTRGPVRGPAGFSMQAGSNSSRRRPGADLSRDPGAEGRGQWAVAEGSETLQGEQDAKHAGHTCEAATHAETGRRFQGHQTETVQLRGASGRGVLLTKHFGPRWDELESCVFQHTWIKALKWNARNTADVWIK